MLRVTVDFHHASSGESTQPLVLDIVNDGSGNARIGNYRITASGNAKALRKRQVRVTGYERALGIPSLVALAMTAITTGRDLLDVHTELQRRRDAHREANV